MNNKPMNYRGYTIKIVNDENPMRPDEWDNTDCFLVYDHSDFCVEVKGFDPQTIFDSIQETKGRMMFEGYHVFPVYAYIHSGVSLSLGRSQYPFNDRWDVSFKGFALVKKQKGWTWTRDKAMKAAEAVVEEWNQYLSGDVWGFVIEDKDGNNLDSCWGFYGYQYCEDEAKAVADHLAAQEWKKRLNRIKDWIRNRVPLAVRAEQVQEFVYG